MRRCNSKNKMVRTIIISLFSLALSTNVLIAQDGVLQESWTKLPNNNSLGVPDNLFGENINHYLGGLSFNHVDVSIPGNNAIPVKIARKYEVESYTPKTPGSGGVTTFSVHEFGDWELAIPKIVTLVPRKKKWRADRCSGSIKAYGEVWKYFDGGRSTGDWTSKWWKGILLYDVDGNAEKLMEPLSGATKLLGRVSKNNWKVSCKTIADDGKEGFVAQSPNGLKYTFSHITERPYQNYNDDRVFPINNMAVLPIRRKEMTMWVSTVEDQFGNFVNYEYGSNGKLSKIESNDGRKITLTYIDGAINSVTANSKTWKYEYRPVSSTNRYKQLKKVILPNKQFWEIELNNLDKATVFGGKVQCGGKYIFCITGSLTHPNGARSEYKVKKISLDIHYQGPAHCSGCLSQIRSWSLVEKKISGPGISEMTWNYDYEEGLPREELFQKVTITDPESNQEVLHHYRYRDVMQGLLKKRELKHQNNIQEIEEYEYASLFQIGKGYEGLYNESRELTFNQLTEKQITRGTNIYKTVYSNFDNYGRPTKTVESNNINNDTKTTIKSYFDYNKQWVLSLPWETKINGLVSEKMYYFSSPPHNPSAIPPKFKPDWIDNFGARVASYTYYPDGNYKTVKNGQGNFVTYSNYKRGIPQSTKVGNISQPKLVNVNNDGTIKEYLDHKRNKSTYSYDSLNRVVESLSPLELNKNYWKNVDVSYKPVSSSDLVSGSGLVLGQWKRVTTHGVYRLTNYYDALLRGVLTKQEDLVTGEIRYVNKKFDSYNREKFSSWVSYNPSEPLGLTTVYDALGRVAKEIRPEGTTSTSYLGSNSKKVIDPKGNVTNYYYQSFGYPDYEAVIRIEAPEGITTEIDRDVFGKIKSVKQSGIYAGQSISKIRTFEYDSRQQLCRKHDPETGYTAINFDDSGALKWELVGTSKSYCNSTIIPNGATKYFYNDRGLVTKIEYPAGTENVSYTYDDNSNMLTANVGLKNWTYTYNSLNKLESETLTIDGRIYKTTYGYDGRGNLNDITYPTGRKIDYLPNAFGEATQAGKYVKDVNYHPSGLVKNFTFGNNKVYTLSEDNRFMPETISVSGIANMTYDFDSNNNISSIKDNLFPSETKSFIYDEVDRLKTASGPWGNAKYFYDPLSNIRAKQIFNKTYTYNYDYNKNLLSSVRGSKNYDFEYDAQGNVINNGQFAFYYDKANQMLSVNGGATSINEYDAHKRRVLINRSGEKIYSVYSDKGIYLHKDNSKHSKQEDYIYLGRQNVAKVEGVPGPQAPIAPTYLDTPFINATGSFTISWPKSTGATSYTIQQQKNNGGWSNIYTGIFKPRNVKNLLSGIYRYRIKACSSVGCSQYKDSAPVVVDVVSQALPSVPSNLVAPVIDGDGNFIVAWGAVMGANTYELQRKLAIGNWTTIRNSADRNYFEAWPVNGMIQYKVRACNDNGCSDYTPIKSVSVLIHNSCVGIRCDIEF